MTFWIIRSPHYFPHRIFADAQPLSGALDRPGLDVDMLHPLLEGKGSWVGAQYFSRLFESCPR